MESTIKKLEELFDEIYSQCEDGPDKLLCTHESHKEMLKHFIFNTYTTELIKIVIEELKYNLNTKRYTDRRLHDAVLWMDIRPILDKIILRYENNERNI